MRSLEELHGETTGAEPRPFDTHRLHHYVSKGMSADHDVPPLHDRQDATPDAAETATGQRRAASESGVRQEPRAQREGNHQARHLARFRGEERQSRHHRLGLCGVRLQPAQDPNHCRSDDISTVLDPKVARGQG